MGLLQQAQPAAPAQQQAPAGPSGEQAPANAQAIYDKVMTMLLQFLYSDQGVQAVAEGLKMPGEPVQNIANIAAKLIAKLWLDTKQQGKALPEPLVRQVLIELVEAISDMAIDAGVLEKGQANQVAKQAVPKALEIAEKEMPQGAVAPEERQRFASGLQRIMQADAQRSGQNPQAEQESAA